MGSIEIRQALKAQAKEVDKGFVEGENAKLVSTHNLVAPQGVKDAPAAAGAAAAAPKPDRVYEKLLSKSDAELARIAKEYKVEAGDLKKPALVVAILKAAGYSGADLEPAK